MKINRRQFLGTTAAVSATCSLPLVATAWGQSVTAAKPAILGGEPVRKAGFPAWPIIDDADEKSLVEVLKSGKWSRSFGGAQANRFETVFAQACGAKHCIATANGTSALLASLGALEVGPGDEVVIPPYTFVATLNAVLLNYALPVFVDTDPATFQIDAAKVPGAITNRTTAIIPVHIGGGVADLDTILAAAKPRKIPVIEDACQAHLAEWRGRKVGSIGDAGCFSFQASKNWNCGEGGAVLCQDADLAERVYAFHNNSRPRQASGYSFTYLGTRGANLRLTDFQASLLLSQMARVETQSRRRTENAQRLTQALTQIPGITPARDYPASTRNAYHLYMFRYEAEKFGGNLSRAKFVRALQAEGIPCSTGYSPLNQDPMIQRALESRAYRRVYPPEVLKAWTERNRCPVNDRLCQEAVWFTQTMLLGPGEDMDQIAEAIRRIHAHASSIAKA